ncbi:MAG TPA: TetR/AcrR family transcriptional regulator [Planctomycetota bacterium]|nr:TetR/AcrR family transcriptional regulator [Planctomycetota bacterium]
MSRLLTAAVTEFAESGYEAATMNGIARRARSPIGSLYQFFPNKQSVARALRTRQIEDIQALWASLRDERASRSLDGFVNRFMELMTEFVRGHPAFVPLLDAPSSTIPVGARDRLRQLLETLLSALDPGIGSPARTRCAEVILHLNKALMGLFARSAARDRAWIMAEYRVLLRGYLASHVAPRGKAPGVRRRKSRSES